MALAAGLTSTRGAVRILVYVGSDIDHVGLWIMSDYVRTVAVLEYVDGHFELKQSDMILHAVLGTGPLDRRGADHDRFVASSGEFLGPIDRTASGLLHPQADLARKRRWRY